MIDCHDCQEHLLDYVHGELDDREHESLTRHLAGCSACALAYCGWRADVEGIVRAHHERPRPEIRAALRHRVEREFAPSPFRRLIRWWRRPIPVYGAVVATLVPVLVWLVATGIAVRDRDADASTRPALLTDYDATTISNLDGDVL